MADMFGKSQPWFDDVGAVQKNLSIIGAEIAAFPSDKWDAIYTQLEAMKKAGVQAPLTFSSYDWSKGEVIQQLKNVIVTEKHIPTDAAIATAKQRAQQFRTMLTYAKGILGNYDAAAKAEVEAVAAEQAKRVDASTKLRSPADVGIETFKREVEARSKALLSGTGDLIKYVAIGAVAIAGIYATSKIFSK